MRNRLVKVVGTDVAVEVPAEDKEEQTQNYALGPVWNFAKGTVAGAATRAWCTVSGYAPLAEVGVTMLNSVGNYAVSLLTPAADKLLVNKNLSTVEADVLLLDRKVGSTSVNGNAVPQSYYVTNAIALTCAAGAGLILWGTGGSAAINDHMVNLVGDQAAPYVADIVKQAVGTGGAYLGKLAAQGLGETPAVTGLLARVGLYKKAAPASMQQRLLDEENQSYGSSSLASHGGTVAPVTVGGGAAGPLVQSTIRTETVYQPTSPGMGRR